MNRTQCVIYRVLALALCLALLLAGPSPSGLTVYARAEGERPGEIAESGPALGQSAAARSPIDIPINAANFPDPIFRNYVLSMLDDGNGVLSQWEIDQITYIDVSGMGISDLTGIGYFTGLIELYCGENQLTSLDVSALTCLETLFCNNNRLTGLDVSGCTSLQTLYCEHNQLTGLDISGLSSLDLLWCQYNRMASEADIIGLDDLSVSNLVFDPQYDPDKTYHNLTINYGSNSTVSIHAAGHSVRIDAYVLEGLYFREWIVESGGVTLADSTAATVIFTMPAKDVVLSAVYEDLPASHYSITVYSYDNGTAGASVRHAAPGTEILLTTTPDKGYRLWEWRVDGDIVAVKDNRFIMPADNVVIYAYFEVNIYMATIYDGSGSGEYEAGDTVSIAATTIPGLYFREWLVVSDSVTLADSTAARTTFIMPAKDVVIIAVYEELPDSHYSITVYSYDNGTARASVRHAAPGTEITLTATPDSGYRLQKWEVEDELVTITGNRFTMPTGNVVIFAWFEEIAGGSGSGGSSGGSSSSNRSSDSGGSSAPDSTRTVTFTAAGQLNVDAAKAKAAVSSSRDAGRERTRITNQGTILVQKDAWDAFGTTGVDFDTMSGNTVQVRLTVREPSGWNGEYSLSGWVAGNTVESRRAIFERWFQNPVRVVHLDQAGRFPHAVEAAAKVDLTGMDTSNLVLYSYDQTANSYTRIPDANVRVDSNGYLRFTTILAGDIVVSEGELLRR